jgi:hypothetical protein
MISLASVVYGNSQVTRHLLWLHLVFQPISGWDDLGFFQLQSNSSLEGARNIGGYIWLHMKITESKC